MKKRKDKKEYSVGYAPVGAGRNNPPVPLPIEERYAIEKRGQALKEKEERNKRKQFFDSLHCYPLIQLLGGFDGLGRVHYRPSADGQIIEVAFCRWVDGDNPRDWTDAEKIDYFRDHTSDEWIANWMANWKMSTVRPYGWVNYTRWYPLTTEGLKEFCRECNYLMDRKRFLYVMDIGEDHGRDADDWETMKKELRRRENSQRGRENVAKARAAGRKIGRPRKAK
jgi:hypothetical protein